MSDIPTPNTPKKSASVHFASIGGETVTIDLDSLITTYYTFDKETITTALNDNDLPSQRQMSAYFYSFSGAYRHLAHKVAGMHYYRNIITPQFYLSKSDKFNEKLDKDVMKYYRYSKVENTCYNIALLAIIFGSCSTYEIVLSDGNVVHQILPAEYCRTRRKDEFGNNIVEFNFQYFDKVLNSYDDKEKNELWKTLPKEFKKLYQNYKANKSNCNDARNPRWQQLDAEFARCTMSTLSGSPLFATMFPEIVDYEDYKSIDIEKAKQKLFRLIVQKYELDDEGEPVAGDLTVLGAHKNLNKVVDKVAGALTTPFEVSAVSLEDKSTSNEIKYAENQNKIMNSSAGIQQSVFGTTDTVGASATNASNALLATELTYIISQFENWYLKRVNSVSKGKVIYDFKILNITVFNEKDAVGNFKQQLDLGGSLFLYASSIGIPQHIYDGLLTYEGHMKIKDKMIPLINSNQASAEDIKGGTNKKDDSEKADTTIEKDDIRT